MSLRDIDIDGPISGRIDPAAEGALRALEAIRHEDAEFSFQLAAYRDGELFVDVWAGPHLAADSLLVPWSVTKSILGFSIALLIERGQLDLDARVAGYWPEFAAKGKQHVTVRQVLSHQAGLPQAQPRLTVDELLDAHQGAQRLADTRPFWAPGAAYGYHAATIGNLGAELVFRVTGSTIHEFYENEIRRPYDIEFYLGLPEELDPRLVHHLPLGPLPEELGERPYSFIGAEVFAPPPGGGDVHGERGIRIGHVASSGTASARGIASLYAAGTTGVNRSAAFLTRDTIETVSQLQASGHDSVLGLDGRAHGVVFMKPTSEYRLGGARAFGHDGAHGGIGWTDPDTGVAVGYVVARAPWPGGGDRRVVPIIADLLAALR